MIETYFPTGIVTGNAFCNREKEREYLKKRLEQNAHVVLMSPRRYGKSSLIAQFVQDNSFPSISIDLLPAMSGKYIKNVIMDGVTQLLNVVAPRSKKKIMHTLASMNPVIELSTFGQKIKLNPEEKTYEETIMKLLMGLDETAKSLNQRFIFVMDEFQQIATLEASHALEASIRHAVERSRHVFYIFSGSNRTLLEEMFKNKNRPLYHLCDEMKLSRITKTYYEPFIEKAARVRWKKAISHDSINSILFFTERHPYYLNRLCRMLWDEALPPTVECVESTWLSYVAGQKMDWVAEMIGQFTANQKAVLAALAKSPEKEPSGKAFAMHLSLASSSIQRTIAGLLKKDLIYKDAESQCYAVLNPVIKTILAQDRYID